MNFRAESGVLKQKPVNFSIIQTGAVIEGDVSVKGKIVINGTIKGTLSADTVVVSTGGTLLARAEVEKMVVAGKFEGEVTAREELVILKSGDCSGTVVCKNLVVEPGGILNAAVSYGLSHIKEVTNGK